MKIYARISGDVVAELITIDGGPPLTERFPSAFVAACDDVTGVSPQPQVGWLATQTAGVWAFTAPVIPSAPQQPPIRAELSTLDLSIPRGLEDMWAASGFDTTKLPSATQTKLTQKVTLRAELAALVAAGTP